MKNFTFYFIIFVNLNVRTNSIAKEIGNDFYSNINISKKINVFPDIIALDLCGTVIDSKETDIESINKTIKKYKNKNLEWKNIKHLKDPNKSMKENFINFFGEEKYKQAYEYYIKNLINTVNEVELFEGVIDFLKYCKDNEIKLALITNRDRDYVEAFIKRNKNSKKIIKYIDVIMTADEAKFTKPNYKILEKTLEKINLNKNNIKVFFIGDSLADLNLVVNNKINGTFILLEEIINDIKNNNNINNLKYNKNILFFKNYKDLLIQLRKFLDNKIKNFVIIAPPGSGKTTLNIEIAKNYDKEIFSFDNYMDSIFTKYLRDKINDENEYTNLKLNILIDKINNINFNKYIVDLGGGSIYCNKDFIDSIKQKNIKIIYYYVPLKTIKKRFKKNKREIDSRKLFLNKEGNWENVLENYYNNCFELKQYSDFYIDTTKYKNHKEIIKDINQFLLTN